MRHRPLDVAGWHILAPAIGSDWLPRFIPLPHRQLVAVSAPQDIEQSESTRFRRAPGMQRLALDPVPERLLPLHDRHAESDSSQRVGGTKA